MSFIRSSRRDRHNSTNPYSSPNTSVPMSQAINELRDAVRNAQREQARQAPEDVAPITVDELSNIERELIEKLRRGDNTIEIFQFLNNFIDYFYGGPAYESFRMLSIDNRIKIMNIGIRAMRNNIIAINDAVERSRRLRELYNWGTTKITQIISIAEKGVGLLTLSGLFYMYLPIRLRGELQNIEYLGDLLSLCELIQPLIIDLNNTAAALAAGYYILIRSGFQKDEIIDFIGGIGRQMIRAASAVTNVIHTITIEPLLTYIGNWYAQDIPNIQIAYTPSLTPSLSQTIFDISAVRYVDANLDSLLMSLRNDMREIEQQTQRLSQQLSSQEREEQQLSSQERQELYDEYGGKRRRHKRRTHRRRKGRSSAYRKRRHTNRRRSRRHRRR